MQEQKPIIEYADFAKIDLRVGVIKQVEAIPKADKLLKLTVDVGEAEPRTICAGIKQFYGQTEGQMATLVGRKIIVVVNLAPREMRGVKSQGMLLAASNDDHSRVELVSIIAEDAILAQPGDVVG